MYNLFLCNNFVDVAELTIEKHMLGMSQFTDIDNNGDIYCAHIINYSASIQNVTFFLRIIVVTNSSCLHTFIMIMIYCPNNRQNPK